MSSYFSTLKSYYIDHYLSIETFDKSHIAFITKSRKRFFLKQNTTCLPIIKDIFEKISKNKLVNLNELNIDIAFKMV